MILKNTIFPLNSKDTNNSGDVVKRYRTSKKIKNFLIIFFKIFFDDIRLSSLLRAVAISKGVAHHPQPLYAKYSSTSYFTTAVPLKSQCRVGKNHRTSNLPLHRAYNRLSTLRWYNYIPKPKKVP